MPIGGDTGIAEGVLLASAARTTLQTTANQTSVRARGLLVYLNVTVAPGTDSITVRIQTQDPASLAYVTILQSAAITATGMVRLLVYPGITASANLIANEPLPATWRVTVTPSAASSFTYSLGYATLP